ncbi:RHS repeat-associated core domain-containing protein [Streptomyces sp. NPDC048361]|uniref:RHS repeat-associated core domain-containing protein n=1 Tax=Streptomyces sp. NPDC048361 TaxID=3154720 RepID=UPI00344937AE
MALQLPLDISRPPLALDQDEYGNARIGQAAARYNWLGGYQRSTDTPAGLTLMGARIYSLAVGRFLSIGPVAGGSCNRYEYACADPRDKYDLDGTSLMERVQRDCNSYNCVRTRRICDRSSHKCSLQWDMWFRRAWSGAYIEAGWRYELSVRGHRVTSGSYSHGELGWHNFHGYW